MQTTVVYYRVSTKRQQRSGLGLDAQKQMAMQYASTHGGIIADFTEAESGKDSNRPEIKKAIAKAMATGSVLYIATLDRLARNVAFIANLLDSRLDIVVGDMPYASKFTLHIMAAVAEEEGRRISERTRKGLEQAKLRGIKLGSQNPKWIEKRVGNPGLAAATGVSAKNRTKKAEEFYKDLIPMIKGMRDTGSTLAQIADDLNTKGYSSRSSVSYTASIVCRLLKRYRRGTND